MRRMKKSILIIILIAFLLMLNVNPEFLHQNSIGSNSDPMERRGPTTVVVDKNGNGDFSTIKEAIDNSNPGDTVRVYDGTYNENLFLNHTLTLLGNGTTTVLSGQESYYAISLRIKVYADNCNISGFLFKGVKENWCEYGLIIRGNYTTVRDCGFIAENESFTGVHIQRSIGNVLINNTFEKTGVWIKGEEKNQWTSHSIDGSNTVDNMPIKYLINKQNENIKTDFGQLIAVDCDDLIIRNLDLSDRLIVIQIAFSKNVDIVDCHFKSIFWDAFKIHNSEDILINNNTFEDSSFLIAESQNATITKNQFTECKSCIDIDKCSNIDIIQNDLIDGNAWGISLDETNHSSVQNNRIYNGSREAITLWDSNFNSIINNEISWDNDTGIYLTNSHYNSISNNRVTFCNDDGIRLIRSTSNQIEYNICNNNTEEGIYIGELNSMYYTPDYNNITNNSCSGNKYGIRNLGDYGQIRDNTCNSNHWGIKISSSGYCIIDNNTCNNNIWYGIDAFMKSSRLSNNSCEANKNGIQIKNTDQSVIENNTCIYNLNGFKTSVDYNGNTIINNNFSNNDDYGLYLSYGDNHTISGNRIESNRIGLYGGGTVGSIFEENIIKSNEIGVHFTQTESCRFSKNIIESCDSIEIHLEEYCYDNEIYNNIFIGNNSGNTIAIDNGTNNVWDNGYTGNYWSDWLQPDVDMDGIVDIPYIVNGSASSRDHFPMTYLETGDQDKDWYMDHIEEQYDSEIDNSDSIPPDIDLDRIPDPIDSDRDGDGHPNDEDIFPDDPDKWKRPKDEDSSYLWVIVLIIILILLAVIAVAYIVYSKRKPIEDAEEPTEDKRSLKQRRERQNRKRK